MVVRSNGRVVVGQDRPNDDRDNVLSMSIYGRSDSLMAGSKLAFGDFGRFSNGGWNVFVGEFGSHDSDMLWLHGKNGIRATAFGGPYLISDWSIANGWAPRLTLYDGVRLDRLAVSSDDDHKSSIKAISYALPRLMRLTGITYKYHPLENVIDIGNVGGSDSVGQLSPKDSIGQSQYSSVLKARSKGDTRYGLVTSDLISLFPELVEVDSLGNQYVNYIELIPVIITAINELCTDLSTSGTSLYSVEDYESLIQDSSSYSQSKSAARRVSSSVDSEDAILYQNTPNPFTNETTIGYHIPDSSTNAGLYVFTLTGELLQSYPIATMGDGQIAISASTLNAGMYLYSLVVDDRVVDTKRMILTK